MFCLLQTPASVMSGLLHTPSLKTKYWHLHVLHGFEDIIMVPTSPIATQIGFLNPSLVPMSNPCQSAKQIKLTWIEILVQCWYQVPYQYPCQVPACQVPTLCLHQFHAKLIHAHSAILSNLAPTSKPWSCAKFRPKCPVKLHHKWYFCKKGEKSHGQKFCLQKRLFAEEGKLTNLVWAARKSTATQINALYYYSEIKSISEHRCKTLGDHIGFHFCQKNKNRNLKLQLFPA